MKLDKEFWIGIVLLVVLTIMFVEFSDHILLMSPGGQITNRTPELKWMGGQENYNLVVDDGKDFVNPVVNVWTEKDNYELIRELSFDTYYWKVIGYENGKKFESSIGMFTVDPYITYSVDENKLKNLGNSLLKVTDITGFSVLEVGDEKILNDGENILEQHG